MCGRYQFGDDLNNAELQKIVEQLNREFAGSSQLAKMKTGEIFPTDTVPIITQENDMEHFQLMDWGFPKWNSGGVVINARAETVSEKPMFRESFQKRRCVIPSTGFYEWRHQQGRSKGEKYLLRIEGQPVLYMAGLYNIVRDADGGFRKVFVILTTDANEFVAPIHDRMPLILDRQSKGEWLDEASDKSGLLIHPPKAKLALIPAV